jgi:hypothetical protein
VVCLLALGIDDAVHVTTILLLFDKNELFCLKDITFTKNLPIKKVSKSPPPLYR